MRCPPPRGGDSPTRETRNSAKELSGPTYPPSSYQDLVVWPVPRRAPHKSGKLEVQIVL